MIYRYLILSIFLLTSCTTTDLRTGYIITFYDSLGKVKTTYNVEDYDLSDNNIKFTYKNEVKVFNGQSFKIEKLYQ